MGKQRFRLSHMIPNAWFYRLRDMNTATHHNKKPLPSTYSSTPNSFCYTPRLYSNSPTNNIYTSPTELTHNTHHQDNLFPPPTSTSYYDQSPFSESTRSLDKPPSASCSCGGISSSTTTTDVVIEYFNEKSYTEKNIQDSSGYELIQEIELPPIITKSNNQKITTVEKKEESSNQSSISIKIVKESVSKKEDLVSGVEIRSDSCGTPVSKRIVDVNNDQKNNLVSSSCCIVKPSFDPQKDFKESMVEMIVEDKIWDSKDLEKLLASYLSLNSSDYHEMIIKAFEEIWRSFEFVN